jgi:hypothetical protein
MFAVNDGISTSLFMVFNAIKTLTVTDFLEVNGVYRY